jgi:hypothetical protein
MCIDGQSGQNLLNHGEDIITQAINVLEQSIFAGNSASKVRTMAPETCFKARL